MRRIMTSVVMATVSMIAGRASAAEGWHEDGVHDGVQVEHRDVEGSAFTELRLSLVTTASVSQMCAAIYPAVLPEKLERHFKKRDLLRETATDRWTYEQIAVPVLSDRDYILHAKIEVPASTGHCVVSFGSETDAAHPPADGFVRIPVIRGRWDVFPIENGKVSVQYRIFSEPGGGVPAFMCRGSQKSTAIDFMKLILARATGPAAP